MFYLALLLVNYLGLTGAFMLISPEAWFQTVPGVSETGGFNAHFITDIGFVFLLAGVGISWGLLDPVRARSAALMGTGFLVLHAGFHFYETLFSSHHGNSFSVDVLGIYAPAALAIILTSIGSLEIPAWLQNLLRPLTQREIRKFETEWDYDASYMHDIAAVDFEAIGRFSLLQELGDYRKSIPKSAWYAVKLLSCIREDCGPCTQLIVNMAEKDGVAPEILMAIVEGRPGDLDETNRLFYDYANAVLDHDLRGEELRRRIIAQYGAASAVSAGLSMITGKAYPLMKYALGHGQHCLKVSVNGERKSVYRPPVISAEPN